VIGKPKGERQEAIQPKALIYSRLGGVLMITPRKRPRLQDRGHDWIVAHPEIARHPPAPQPPEASHVSPLAARSQSHALKGYDFSRANKANRIKGLYRLQKNSIRTGFVSGHDFSRTNKASRIKGALAPEGGLWGRFACRSPFLRSLFSPWGMYFGHFSQYQDSFRSPPALGSPPRTGKRSQCRHTRADPELSPKELSF
jgi:hypothetical protein